MLDFAREALQMTDGRRRVDLDSDRMLQLSLISLVSMVGEAASRVSQDTRVRYPRITWAEAVGMRHRVIHGYDSVDWDLVWNTVRGDFPSLVTELQRALEDSTA